MSEQKLETVRQLLYACEDGKLETVRQLLMSEKIDINCHDINI